jgi:hypothetical protein
MTPSRPVDELFTLLATPNPAEVVVRLAVSWRDMRPDWRPALNSKYKDLPLGLSQKPDVARWGEYELVQITDGPHPYHYYYYAPPKTDEELRVPWRTVKGKSRHYDWPAVLHGIAFAEDPEFRVEVNLNPQLKATRPRLVARPILTVATFALCGTEVQTFQGPRPFEVQTRKQPAPSEVRWQVDGGEERLTCLHDNMWLPAEGKSWSLKFAVGQITGSPSDKRFFPATPMVKWEPFVVAQSHEQLESGIWQLVVEWIFPPPVGELSGF